MNWRNVGTYFRLFSGLLILIVLSSCSSDDVDVEQPNFYKGVDLSFQPEINEFGFDYRDSDGNSVIFLPFLKNKGANLVRLRLWHSPATQHSGLDEVLTYAREIKGSGMNILLDFHFSDTWADPGQQSIPQAWRGLSFDEIKGELSNYTKTVLTALENQGTLPELVQIGNETNAGFLWDIGRTGGVFDDNWPNFKELLGASIQAVREIDATIEIVIHFAGLDGSMDYFENLRDTDYDVMGLSYYSLWHGKDLMDLQNKMFELTKTYQKELLLVETAYPWTLEWNDNTHNLWGLEDQLISGYPATPTGQHDFLVKLLELVQGLPDSRGIGVCYWAPDWTAFKGGQSTMGSSWENATFFDFDGNALPIIEALSR